MKEGTHILEIGFDEIQNEWLNELAESEEKSPSDIMYEWLIRYINRTYVSYEDYLSQKKVEVAGKHYTLELKPMDGWQVLTDEALTDATRKEALPISTKILEKLGKILVYVNAFNVKMNEVDGAKRAMHKNAVALCKTVLLSNLKQVIEDARVKADIAEKNKLKLMYEREKAKEKKKSGSIPGSPSIA